MRLIHYSEYDEVKDFNYYGNHYIIVIVTIQYVDCWKPHSFLTFQDVKRMMLMFETSLGMKQREREGEGGWGRHLH